MDSFCSRLRRTAVRDEIRFDRKDQNRRRQLHGRVRTKPRRQGEFVWPSIAIARGFFFFQNHRHKTVETHAVACRTIAHDNIITTR